MGCWNETCALTHLPITYGDRAVYLPIAEVAHYGNYKIPICYYYPSDMFQVSGLPIRGTYNDYGTLEKVDDTSSMALTVKCFQKLLEDKKLTIEDWKDSDGPTEIKDIYSLQELIERERLFYGGKRAIGFMAMHEEFYDAITDRILKRKLIPNNNTFKNEIEECLKKAKKNKDILEVIYKIDRSDSTEEEIIRKRTMRSIEIESKDNEVFSFFNGEAGVRNNQFLDGILYLEAVLKDMSNVVLIKDVIDLFAFNTALRLMRVMYAPQCGKGSQFGEYDLHAILAKGILKKTEEVIKEVSEDRELEEDEYPTAEGIYNFYSMMEKDE